MTSQYPRPTTSGSPSSQDQDIADWETLVEPAPTTRREALALEPDRHGRRRPRRGRRAIVIAVIAVVVLAIIGAGGLAAYSQYPDQVKSLFGWSDDYTGAGSGSVQITIEPGQLGSQVAATLAAADVTKTREAFYDLLVKTTPQPSLEPGTYRLRRRMSAAAALAALQNPANLVQSTVAIPEGSTAKQIWAIASQATGIPVAQFTAAAKDYTAFGVPSRAPSIEGFLFPATYRFQPGTTAKQIIQAMVTRMDQALDSANVPTADRFTVLTLAGLVQKEGNGSDDAKVARVFENRLQRGMPLQSDATVSYGAGGTTVVPTPKQYDDDNGYNTYLHKGLPKGPISNPGDVAIDAALHPAKGSWLYFVTVNLATGETVFSNTVEEHDKAQAQFQSWLAAHPSYGK